MAEQFVICNKTDLDSVADAIKTKSGSSGNMNFPQDLVSRVDEIETGSKQKLIKMTVNCTTLDSVACGGKTYREIFLTSNIFTTGNGITDSTNTGWSQYSTIAKPTSTTSRYNTRPSSLNCSGSTSVQMYKDLSLTNGNVFYIACKRMLTSYTAGKWLGVEVYYIGGAGKVISDTINANNVSETFETVSHTFTPKTATTQIWIGSGGSANLTGYVDDVVCVNMTELFGDNVPSRAQMDDLYEQFLYLYKLEVNGDELYAYGAFTNKNGEATSCKALVEDGKTYYVLSNGTSSVVVFKAVCKAYNDWVNVTVSSQDETNAHAIGGCNEFSAYCMHFVGNSNMYDVVLNIDLTTNRAINKLIAIADAEVGYIEKASNSQLDDKTANPGSANYTKYARDLDAISGFYNGSKQGSAYCDVFTDWCFVQAFGVDIAKTLLCQPSNSLGAGVGYSAEYYKNSGRYYTSNPRVGDQIFFVNENNAYVHTGIVYKVACEKVYTIEGNTEDPTGVNAYRGVYKKEYNLSDSTIDGYGRPNYYIV
jgi:hypothetical protein